MGYLGRGGGNWSDSSRRYAGDTRKDCGHSLSKRRRARREGQGNTERRDGVAEKSWMGLPRSDDSVKPEGRDAFSPIHWWFSYNPGRRGRRGSNPRTGALRVIGPLRPELEPRRRWMGFQGVPCNGELPGPGKIFAYKNQVMGTRLALSTQS